MKRKFPFYFLCFVLFALTFLFSSLQKVLSQSIYSETKSHFKKFRNYEFRGSNRVADNPVTWKIKKDSSVKYNEINSYEVYMHRDSSMKNNPLIFIADLEMSASLEEAHLDFECFWTDIRRGKTSFLNIGPHAGHTSWLFNKEGNLVSPGDILISADFEKKQVSGFRYCLWLNPKNIPGGSLDEYNKLSNSIFKFTGFFISGKKSGGYGYAEMISISEVSPVLYTSIDNLHSGVNLMTQVAGRSSLGGLSNRDKSKNHFRFAINLNQLGLDLSIYNRIPCYTHYGNLMVKTRKAFSFDSELINFSDPILLENNLDFEMSLFAANEGLLNGKFPGLQLENNMKNPSYIYSSWDGPENFNSVGKRPLIKETGTYQLSLSKKTGCSMKASIFIKGDTTRVRLSSTNRNVSCFGQSDGGIFLNIRSGKAPFIYEWSNGETTASLTGLKAGTYAVSVTADNGKMTVLRTKISEPIPLKLNSSEKKVSKYGGNDGDAIVIVRGGIMPYCYLWNTLPIQDSNKAKKLKAGYYTICVTDASGCELSQQLEIQQVEKSRDLHLEIPEETAIRKY